MDSKVVMAKSGGRMAANIKVVSKMIIWMEMASTTSMMGESTKDNGNSHAYMVKARWSIPIKTTTKGNSRRIK